MTDCYLLSYRLNNRDAYLIWYTDSQDMDQVVLDTLGNLLTASTLNAVADQAHALGFTTVDSSYDLYNLDRLHKWIRNPTSKIDSKEFLDIWNLFTDVSVSVLGTDFATRDDLTNHIYEKLFWGNNLPSVTPEGKAYQPLWKEEEIHHLQGVLKNGLHVFEQHLAL